MSLVKGLLSPVMENDVNVINAMDIARERGIKVEEIKSTEASNYVNSIEIVVTTDKKKLLMTGTLFAGKHPVIVRIDDNFLEVLPNEHMLFIINKDKPGVVGKLGSILGSNGVNIANLSLGRKSGGDEALMVVGIDSVLPEKAGKQLDQDKDFVSWKFIKV
jgi:D-3-phosphoglycerate dehydrogenase